MPYKDPIARKLGAKERQRRLRARRRAESAAQGGVQAAGPRAGTRDQAGEVAAWSEEALKVPAGHPLAGEPMTLPDYGVNFLRDALSHRESLFCVARKSGKSAIVAVLALAYLIGPLRKGGLRLGTISLTSPKAGELLRQMSEIAEASRLQGLQFYKSPAPGHIVTLDGTTAEFLSADRRSGHAAGFDVVLCDELGLFTERDRDLVAGMRTATSARNGRFIALSIRGDSPLLEEMIERRDLPTCSRSPVRAGHSREWRRGCSRRSCVGSGQSRTGRGDQKSLSSGCGMKRPGSKRRHRTVPSFMAYDMNIRQKPGHEMIFAGTDYQGCCVDELPPRAGAVCLGLDIGEALSGSAMVAIWPETGRFEAWLAFGDKPSLLERGRRDGARYDLMASRGELRTYGGRITPVAAFLTDVAAALEGCRVHRIASDSYKDSEVRDFLENANLRWSPEFQTGRRGQGWRARRAKPAAARYRQAAENEGKPCVLDGDPKLGDPAGRKRESGAR